MEKKNRFDSGVYTSLLVFNGHFSSVIIFWDVLNT